MRSATIHPLLVDNAIEAMKLRQFFADAFGASVLAQLIPRLRLLRTSRAEVDEMALFGTPWSEPRVDCLPPEANGWST